MFRTDRKLLYGAFFFVIIISVRNSNIDLRTLYFGEIKNYEHNSCKKRPIITLKIVNNKVLAVQCTTKKPKFWLSKLVIEETNGEVKGIFIGSTYLLSRTKISMFWTKDSKKIRISRKLSKIIIKAIMEDNKNKIAKIQKSLDNNLIAYKRTKAIKYKKAAKLLLQKWKHYDIKNKAPKNIDSYIKNLWVEKT